MCILELDTESGARGRLRARGIDFSVTLAFQEIEYMLQDSIYMKRAEQENPETVDLWLPGAGGGGTGSDC